MEQRSLYLLRQATQAVFKHRRLVVLLFLLVFVPGNVGNLLRDPVYKASAKVMIGRERVYPEVSPLDRKEEVGSLPNNALVNSEMQVLRSRELLQRVHFDLLAQAASRGEEDAEGLGIKALADGISVLRKAESNVVEISYRSSSQDEAISVVNTLVRLYMEYSLELHQSQGATGFFRQEMGRARKDFLDIDKALQKYDAEHGITSISTQKDGLIRQQAQIEADLRRTEAEIVELTTKVASLEAELEYIPQSAANEIEMVPNPLVAFLKQNLARLEMEKERLLQLYTPQHRLINDMEREIVGLRSQLSDQEATIVGRQKVGASQVRRKLEEQLLSAQAQVGALEARRTLLTQRIREYGERLAKLHGQHYEVMRMRRDRTDRKQFYDTLARKYEQLQVSEAMDQAGLSNISIIEAAGLPLKREPDFMGTTLLLSFFAALLISFGSAMVMEMLTPVMNSELDVRYNLGLPVLAELPLQEEQGSPPRFGADDEKRPG